MSKKLVIFIFIFIILFCLTIFSFSFGKNKNYYNEVYRGNYHYSPQKGWANDPNGLVYFDETWHMFYQYYPDDVKWGPMHWGHATSKDLLTWKEEEIALFPGDDKAKGDKKRYIFSGSAVVDSENTSGFFDSKEGGIVLIYTTHTDNNGWIKEEQSLAYSKDNGKTWKKYNDGNPVLTIDQDPLKKPREFRDPKVFYLEEEKKWFMVVAGGPLRFFSSTNLIDWNPEGMHPEIITECPDFIKIKVENTNEYKWVLTYSGRFYQVGDFKKVNGKWQFVNRGEKIEMNFGKDSYAGQSFYNAPNDRKIMVNWMNNWDYANDVGNITKSFNGQFTLLSELNLVKNKDKYVLLQNPIDEYKKLRETPILYKNISIYDDKIEKKLLNETNGSFELILDFVPQKDVREVGISIKSGIYESINVLYDNIKKTVTIDRANGGLSPVNSEKFKNTYSSILEKNEDGSLKMHLFLDKSSLEFYGNNGLIAGSFLRFPTSLETSIEIFSKGGETSANLAVYPMKSIWKKE